MATRFLVNENAINSLVHVSSVYYCMITIYQYINTMMVCVFYTSSISVQLLIYLSVFSHTYTLELLRRQILNCSNLGLEATKIFIKS